MSSKPEGPLRILVVNWLDRENPQAGGAEEHLHQTFGRLAGRGHHVTALVSGWAGCAPRALLDGIEVHRAGSRHTFSVAAPRYYRRHLVDEAYDVVVEDLNKIPLYCRAWVRAPVVVVAHHLFGRTAFQAAPFPVAAVTWLLERTVGRAFYDQTIIAVSEGTRDDLVAAGLRPESIEVVPNGIDLSRYGPDPAVPRAERPTLLFLGRLKRYKRIDLVLAAVPHLVARGHDVRLVVVGDGDQREVLRAAVERARLQDRVTFTGFVTEEEKLLHLRRAWLHVLTSSKEGWGISNLEAGACETPTVASDAPGLRESVVHGETGLLVPHGDAEALVAAIADLLGDRARREAMGRSARRFAERFSWEATADAFEGHFHEVVAAAGRG